MSADDVMNEVTRFADDLGRPYGLTGEQLIAHALLGSQMHPEARPGECGEISPHNERLDWCRSPEGHDGDHDPVGHMPREACGVLLNPPDRYDFCGLPAGHDAETCRPTGDSS